MKKSVTRRILRLSVAALLLLAILVSLWTSIASLSVAEYTFTSAKLTRDITLVQISDFHDNPYLGSRVAEQVQALSPDLVVLTGDLVNYNSADDQRAVDLIKSLRSIAPVYLTVGNHDVSYMRRAKSDDMLEHFEAAGAVTLNSRYADVTVKGQTLRIGGLYDSVFNDGKLPSSPYRSSDAYRFLTAFENTDALKVLLCHKPEHLINDDASARWDIDLALSGHEHGGQVRLPLIGGFYSTHLGFFSPYLDGAHLINGIPVIISRGLGTYTLGARSLPVPPRFWNTPEIVLVKLTGESDE